MSNFNPDEYFNDAAQFHIRPAIINQVMDAHPDHYTVSYLAELYMNEMIKLGHLPMYVQQDRPFKQVLVKKIKAVITDRREAVKVERAKAAELEHARELAKIRGINLDDNAPVKAKRKKPGRPVEPVDTGLELRA